MVSKKCQFTNDRYDYKDVSDPKNYGPYFAIKEKESQVVYLSIILN